MFVRERAGSTQGRPGRRDGPGATSPRSRPQRVAVDRDRYPDRAPRGAPSGRGTVRPRPPRPRPQLALQGQDLRLQVGEERSRPRPPALAQRRSRRYGAQRAEHRNLIEQAVSPSPPHPPSASRRRAGRFHRENAPRARSGARPGARGRWRVGTGTAASRCPGSPPSGAGNGRGYYVASTSRSITSRAVACSRSPSRNFCRRGNFSTVGTSHSTKRYIDSSAGPVRRALDRLPPEDATSATPGGLPPPSSPKELKI